MVLFQSHESMKKKMIFVPNTSGNEVIFIFLWTPMSSFRICVDILRSATDTTSRPYILVLVFIKEIRRKKKTRRKKTSIGKSDNEMRSGMNIEYAMKKEPRERNFRKE